MRGILSRIYVLFMIHREKKHHFKYVRDPERKEVKSTIRDVKFKKVPTK